MFSGTSRRTLQRLLFGAVMVAATLRATPLAAQDDSSAVRGVRTVDVASQPQPVSTQKTLFVHRDFVYAGVGVLASLGVGVFDQRIANWFRSENVQGDSSRSDLVESLTHVNETPLTIAAFATYGIGRIVKSPTTADIGLHTFEALVLTTGVSEVIRGTVGRTRPRASPDDPANFDMGSGFHEFETRSWPSLHAAAAFATATALVGEIRERKPEATKWAAPLLYAAALTPGFTRLYLDQHWASDIVAGAALGALIGNRVVSYSHSHKPTRLNRWLLGVSAMPDGYGRTMILVNARP
jgi:membrane-associated phospholipid phosphatase